MASPVGSRKQAVPRKSFSHAEDVILAQLVSKYGTEQWEAVAHFMGGRNARQCRERWRTFLNPGIVNGPWSHAEDELLIYLHRTYGPKWSKITKHFQGRSDLNVKNRWVRHLQLMNLDYLESHHTKSDVEKYSDPPKEEVVFIPKIESSSPSEPDTVSLEDFNFFNYDQFDMYQDDEMTINW